jgi:hypothetical protein
MEAGYYALIHPQRLTIAEQMVTKVTLQPSADEDTLQA